MCSKKLVLIPLGVAFLITSNFVYYSQADQMTYKLRPFGSSKTITKMSSHDHNSLPINNHPMLDSYVGNVHVQKIDSLLQDYYDPPTILDLRSWTLDPSPASDAAPASDILHPLLILRQLPVLVYGHPWVNLYLSLHHLIFKNFDY